MKILVTGASGQLGMPLCERFARGGNHDVVAAGRDVIDLADRDNILSVITDIAPDIVVHSGAFTAVDLCETEIDTALRINALGTRHVVDAADRCGARVLYVSTDYVFDGTKSSAYDEWDRPNPQSVYGRSKLGGENELRECDTTVRTSWVFGRNGKNMIKTVMRLVDTTDGPLTFVDDQHGKPTCAEDLAEMIYHLAVGRHPGVFHVTNNGPTTWFGFVQEVLSAMGQPVDRVQPVKTADIAAKYPAPRPANSVLDNAALRLSGIPELRDHREAVHDTVKYLMSI